MSEIIPYTYEDIQSLVRTKLITKGYNAGVEGSNAALLSDILAYITSSLNYNSAFNISETILSTATQRKNILLDARALGYEATSRISYQYQVSLVAQKDSSLPDSNTTLRTYEVPKYTKFSSNGNSYYYMGDPIAKELSNNDIVNTPESAIFTFSVKEGDLKLYSDNSDLILIVPATVDPSGTIIPLNYVSIPYSNVEQNGIELYITYVDNAGTQFIDEPWEQSETFLIDKNSNLVKKYFRLRNIEFNTPDIYFNISGVGNVLLVGSIIKANILISNGSLGAASTTSPLSLVSTLPEFTLYAGSDINYSQKLLVTGEDEESDSSIQVNAPLFHNAANRAVVKGDYVAICEKQLSIEFAQVWGGDEETPIKLGHIWFSFIPSSIERTFTNDTNKTLFSLMNSNDTTYYFIKNNELRSSTYDSFGNLLNPGIFDILDNYKVMTMQFHNRMPIYLDFDFKAHVVKYNITNTKLEINQSIFDIINSYFKNYIEKYEVEYFNSNLIKRIDTELTDITGFEMSLDLSILLFKKHINYELDDVNNGRITFFLGYPYENYFSGVGDFIPGILPDISTTNFIGNELVVDWNSMVGNNLTEYLTFDILYNGSICGTYFVSQTYRKFIRVDLWINNGLGSGEYATSPLLESMFSSNPVDSRVSVKYKTYNFKTYRNTAPRLLSVSFS